MLSLTGGMKYMYCECNVSFHYKWDGLESYIKYVLNEDLRSGKVFIFMHKSRRQLRVFYYERNGYVFQRRSLTRNTSSLSQSLIPKSRSIMCGELLMKAIHYAQAEWKGLMEYTKDGHYREG